MKKHQNPTAKKPLQLQRETIRSLDQIDLQQAQGGAQKSDTETGCGYTYTCTCTSR